MKSTLAVLFSLGYLMIRAQTCTPVHREINCPAQFPGGKDAFADWVMLSRNYYPAYKEMVGVSVCVDTTGRAVFMQIVKARPSAGLLESEKEAKRLIEIMPLWEPGRIGENCDEKVCEEVFLPIVFYPKNK